MKLKILNLNKTEVGNIDLPKQFYEPIRKDIIRRAFLVSQSNKRQPYGASPEAGKRASAELSRRRRKYRGSYGLGISRVPRKILSRRGTRMNWVGAFAPGTVGGRRAHPPKASKELAKKINKKERIKAIRSALAASIDLETIKSRGHFIPQNFPFVVKDEINKLDKTNKLKEALVKLGFKEELQRADERGSKGLLLVTTNEKLKKTCSNIPGFEAEKVSNLNAQSLAPGGAAGRITLFTELAIKTLSENKLFTDEFKEEKSKETKSQKSALVKKKLPIKDKDLQDKRKSKETKKTDKK